MKNKLLALLTVLLLVFPAFSTQALAISPMDSGTPPAISEQEEPENSEGLDESASPEHPVSWSSTPVQSEDPGLFDGEH